MKNYIWLIIISLGFLQACGDPKESLSDEDSIFERVTSDVSGVTFKNVVPESETLNQFNYHYFCEGELLRIHLSIIFTFQEVVKLKNSINTNLLILYEILDST